MAELDAPERRTCLRCGREEAFDDDARGWTVRETVGEPFCIHEWDVNGTHNPLSE